MARFSVQQKIAVVNFLIQAQPPVATLLPMPWTRPIVGMQVESLTITVWEKVPSYWATDDTARDCDGFHAIDSTGQVWWNQYPRASYSQTSDANDWRFTRHFDPAGPQTFEELDRKGLLETYEEAGQTLDRLTWGIRHLNKATEDTETNRARAQALTEVRESLVKALNAKGFRIQEEEVLPGIKNAVVTPVGD